MGRLGICRDVLHTPIAISNYQKWWKILECFGRMQYVHYDFKLSKKVGNSTSVGAYCIRPLRFQIIKKWWKIPVCFGRMQYVPTFDEVSQNGDNATGVGDVCNTPSHLNITPKMGLIPRLFGHIAHAHYDLKLSKIDGKSTFVGGDCIRSLRCQLIKKYALGVAMLTTACTTALPEIHFPAELNFQGKTYQQVTDNRLGKMRQSLYLPRDSDKNPEQWQQGILLFSDQNIAGKTLAQRLATRQQHTATTQAAIDYHLTQGELRSQGIYPPTERFPNVQLEVTRGRNLSCGYGQMQFADKRSVVANHLPNLTAYQPELNRLVNTFNQLTWQLECR